MPERHGPIAFLCLAATAAHVTRAHTHLYFMLGLIRTRAVDFATHNAILQRTKPGQ
jgi:hypothetical protein